MRLNASRRSSPRCTSAQPASTGAPSHLLELAAAPETSIVAFRARPTGCPPASLDELNRTLP
jgi:hypothetical protein